MVPFLALWLSLLPMSMPSWDLCARQDLCLNPATSARSDGTFAVPMAQANLRLPFCVSVRATRKIHMAATNDSPDSAQTKDALAPPLAEPALVHGRFNALLGWAGALGSRLSHANREWPPWVLGALLTAAVLLAYSNSLHGPFQYDDFYDIGGNRTIRRLWPLWDVFRIAGKGFQSRPIVNLSFALNFATGGLQPYHYHLTNLGIHVGASLAFLGVVRRTLTLPMFQGRFTGSASGLSLVVAALWALHPLQTESVAYITQRYESIMGLFVFLSFYGLLRMVDSPRQSLWGVVAILSCLLAMGSKEVAVSLPVLVLLYDRTFLAGSYREALRKRWPLYVGLALTWAVFSYVQLHGVQRNFAGFKLTVPWWRYAMNQPAVILHYLRLSLWPHPLNLDHFWPVAKTLWPLIPGFLVLGAMLGFTSWAYFKKPALSFLFLFFFFILAPTSSFMPILDLAVEHRMYLPLAAVIPALVLGIFHAMQVALQAQVIPARTVRMLSLALVASALSGAGAMTYLRVMDYQDPLDLWGDVVLKSPGNPRARHNFGFYLAEAGFSRDAEKEYRIALGMAPNYPLYRASFGLFLSRQMRHSEAIEQLHIANKLAPGDAKYLYYLGGAMAEAKQHEEALASYRQAAEADPTFSGSYYGMAVSYLQAHEVQQSLATIQRAIELEPEKPEYHYLHGLIALKMGPAPEALAAFHRAVKWDEQPANMMAQIGWDLHEHGRDHESIEFLRRSVKLMPDSLASKVRLAWVLATTPTDSLRQPAEALEIVQRLISTTSYHPPALLDLQAVSLAANGQYDSAVTVLRETLDTSKGRNEPWVPELEEHLKLFEKRMPYRYQPIHLFGTGAIVQNPT